MSAQDTFFSDKISQIFNQNSAPVIFGILNITPDSFFDGGKYMSENAWLKRTEEMLTQGADVVDVGAYSSRPGATNISVEEELSRILPVIKSIKKEFKNCCISVDTFRAGVAEKSIDAGADIINDIGGGTLDDGMFECIIRKKIPYVLMHIKGNPQNMQQLTNYTDVSAEVVEFLSQRADMLLSNAFNKIILDPGFGFAKTLEQNYELLNNIDKVIALGFPVMVGFSRKSMITQLIGKEQNASINGTIALNAVALLKGAKILRVHDILEAKQVIHLLEKLKKTN